MNRLIITRGRISSVQDKIVNTIAQPRKMLNLKKIPGTKHPGNLRYHGKAKPMNNRLQGRKKKGTENIQQNHRRKFPQFKERDAYQVQEAYRISSRQNQKNNFSQRIVIKTPNVQNNKDGALKSFKGKRKSHIQRQVH